MMRLASVAIVLTLAQLVFAQEAKDEAQIKPDVAALAVRFKVVKGRFDGEKRRYVWLLEAKETSEDACNFEAVFQNSDEKEVTTAKVEFESGGKGTEKGKRETAVVKYPTRKTMEKVTQILVKKSD